MDEIVIVSAIAKNGLDAAQLAFDLKAAGMIADANDEGDPAKKKKLLARSKKLTKLSKVLKAAEVGLDEFIKETSGS